MVGPFHRGEATDEERPDPVPLGEITPVGRVKGDCKFCRGEGDECACQLRYTEQAGTWVIVEVKGGAH